MKAADSSSRPVIRGQVAPLGHPLIQVVGQQKDGAVYHNEKDGRRNKTIDLGFPHKEGVQLPPPM